MKEKREGEEKGRNDKIINEKDEITGKRKKEFTKRMDCGTCGKTTHGWTKPIQEKDIHNLIFTLSIELPGSMEEVNK